MKKIFLIVLLLILIIIIAININKKYLERISDNYISKKIRGGENNIKTFDEIKDKIKPYDIICFYGDGIISKIIGFFEDFTLGSDEWTHIGMVVTTDIIPIKNGKPGKLYLLDSSMSGENHDGTINIETGVGKSGVQIRSLKSVIKKRLKVAWFKLQNKPVDNTKINEFYKKHCNSNQNINIFPFVNSFLSDVFNDDHERNDMHCSEFIVRFYSEIGILPKNINSGAISPVDLTGYLNKKYNLFSEYCILKN
jgi:hypothetical protein